MTAVHLASAELGDPLPTLNEEQEPLPPPLAMPSHTTTPMIPSPSGSLHRSIIGGMRRWMGSAQGAHAKLAGQTPGKSDSAECAGSHATTHGIDKASADTSNALESVVQRTLSPSISRAEAREYQAYCSQFDQVPFRLSHRATDADMQVYESASSLGYGIIEMIGQAQLRVDGKPMAGVDSLYAAFSQHFQQPLAFVPSTSAALRVASH